MAMHRHSLAGPQTGTDGVGQGQGDVAEHAPPTLAKGTAVSLTCFRGYERSDYYIVHVSYSLSSSIRCMRLWLDADLYVGLTH